MGNDHSQMSGLEINKKAIEVTDFYAHYTATLDSSNITTLSVFIGEPIVGNSLWNTQTPLEKLSKNLMIHRHPCILKYISSWNKGLKFYLAVEDVKPLSHVLPLLNSLQICIGLHSILKAICFLHENALASHNNISIASIYVGKDGNWKLGGMEYLCRFSELKTEYLNKIRNHRYEKAVDPSESKAMKDNNVRKDFVDVYAFGVLACEVLQQHVDGEIPFITPFLNICKNELQDVNIQQRPTLKSLLEHPFFGHDFIMVYSFLLELPLKSDEEKEDFFTGLVMKLKKFNEITVADQLNGLLLSRMVLLNKTAQKELLPCILRPRRNDAEVSDSLFSEENFKKYLIPKLLEIFCVRDAEIRKLLLYYFADFADCFSNSELQLHILPELLVGIKDTNDQLVAATLRSLADLVPILGSSTVIGGKRAKLFNDGRPINHPVKCNKRNSRNSKSIDNERLTTALQLATTSNNIALTQALLLPERPQPDGEEVDTSTDEVEQSAEEDLDNWEDWDVNENSNSNLQNSLSVTVESSNENSVLNSESITKSLESSRQSSNQSDNLENLSVTGISLIASKKKSLPDISELDIKNQRAGSMNGIDEFNFFQDMEPVIASSTKYLVTENEPEDGDSASVYIKKNNLAVANTELNEDGWGDEEWD